MQINKEAKNKSPHSQDTSSKIDHRVYRKAYLKLFVLDIEAIPCSSYDVAGTVPTTVTPGPDHAPD